MYSYADPHAAGPKADSPDTGSSLVSRLSEFSSQAIPLHMMDTSKKVVRMHQV
jgi:hypothetical protein